MEGLFRLSSPLLYLAFTMIGLSLLLSGDFNRRGQFLRILTAVFCVTAVQVIVLSIKNLAEKTPALESVMYLAPMLVAAVSLIILLYGKPRLGDRKASRKNIGKTGLAT